MSQRGLESLLWGRGKENRLYHTGFCILNIKHKSRDSRDTRADPHNSIKFFFSVFSTSQVELLNLLRSVAIKRKQSSLASLYQVKSQNQESFKGQPGFFNINPLDLSCLALVLTLKLDFGQTLMVFSSDKL